jgi:uncharacterized BrkB/YihY/UPF0761 family membrane protein
MNSTKKKIIMAAWSSKGWGEAVHEALNKGWTGKEIMKVYSRYFEYPFLFVLMVIIVFVAGGLKLMSLGFGG